MLKLKLQLIKTWLIHVNLQKLDFTQQLVNGNLKTNKE